MRGKLDRLLQEIGRSRQIALELKVARKFRPRPPAVQALSIMKQLASSAAADPSLPVQMENQNRLAMEAGTAAFELNYPFVYPGMKSDNPAMFKNFKWAPYPEVTPGVPAKVTIGGIDLAVSAYSQHKNLAFQAALCLRDAQNQLIGATVGGVPPTIASLYNDPAMFPDATVWSGYGSGYGFVPLVLPIFGLLWLRRWSRQARTRPTAMTSAGDAGQAAGGGPGQGAADAVVDRRP